MANHRRRDRWSEQSASSLRLGSQPRPPDACALAFHGRPPRSCPALGEGGDEGVLRRDVDDVEHAWTDDEPIQEEHDRGWTGRSGAPARTPPPRRAGRRRSSGRRPSRDPTTGRRVRTGDALHEGQLHRVVEPPGNLSRENGGFMHLRRSSTASGSAPADRQWAFFSGVRCLGDGGCCAARFGSWRR